ncbi:DEAD/DEAH box helicase family protein [Sphingomonas sp.]|uniref:LPD3 domain-containing protein n=1 Tax=Sphingomonas sp. TaxID=28214 RepID=UPI00307E2CC3
MAAAALAAPGYVASLAGQIGQQRAENDGRSDADLGDVAAAAPAAGASLLLERVGIKGIFGQAGGNIATRVGKAAGKEAATEALQSDLEYTGGTLGTKKGWDAGEAIDNMAAGAVAGGGTGGAIRTIQEAGTGTVRLIGSRLSGKPTSAGVREMATVEAAQVTPDDEASPLPTELVAAGKAIVGASTSASTANSMLAEAGMPNTGTRVEIAMPGGETLTGTVEDAFETDGGEAGTSRGIRVQLDGGGVFAEHFDTIADAGVRIAPIAPSTAEADAIDAGLAAAAQAGMVDTSATSPVAAPPARSAAGGAPSPAPAARPGNLDAMIEAVMPRIGRAESPNDTAKNPRSSAQGRYQFTDGTWLSMYAKVFGKTGESREQILAKKVDGAIQDQVMRAFTRENAVALQRAGAPVTPGTLYLAHFAGSGGARALLSADPNADVETVLGAAAVKANPFLKGKTVADTIAWAAGKVGDASGAAMASTISLDAQPIQWTDIDRERSGERDGDDDSGLRAVGAGAADAISGNMYDMLYERVERGEVAENGQPSVILQAARAIRAGGGIVTRETLPRLGADVAAIRKSGATGAAFQEAMRGLIATWAPPSKIEALKAQLRDSAPKSASEAPAPLSAKAGLIDKNDGWPVEESVRDLARDDGRYAVRGRAKLKTQSGRWTSPAPKFNDSTRAARKRSLAAQEEWLRNEAIAEAEAAPRGSAAGNALPFLRSMKPGNMSMSDHYTVNDVLFGDMNGPAGRASWKTDRDPGPKKPLPVPPSPPSRADGLPSPYQETEDGEAPQRQTGTPRAETERAASPANPGSRQQMPGKRTTKEYQQQGWNAAESGWSIDDDPYLPTSTASDAWRKGFRSSDKIAKKGAGPAAAKQLYADDDPSLTPNERAALEYAMRSDRRGGAGWSKESSEGAKVAAMLAEGRTRDADDEATLTTAVRLFERAKTSSPAPVDPEPAGSQSSPGATLAGDAVPPPAPATPSGYGSKNRLVTAERAEELRKRLKAKMNQLNSGVDPEALAIGIELAIFHIEAGARKFSDFVRAINADIEAMGEDPAKMRAYLRGWYNGARDTMEDQGEDVSDLDGPGAVRAAFTMLQDTVAPQATQPSEPATETVDAVPASLSGSDARAGTTPVQPAAPQRDDGRAPETEGRGSGDAVPAADRGRGEDTGRRGERPDGSSRSGEPGDGNADRVPARERGLADRVAAGNYRIEPGALAESRGPKQKAMDNLAAIEIVKKLQAEGRRATLAEQQAIARYVGWGGLKNAFPDTDGRFGKGFEEIGARLRGLLTDAEYDTARRSIQYAHYTAEGVVRAMWSAAERFGVLPANGAHISVFEPGMGTGNFAGMMPDAVRARASYSGIEMDGITAAIAKALYPDWGVRQADMTKLELPRGSYDLVIGNPPFSETVITADPAYRAQRFLLHDYFFAKSLDAVRPGGVLLFVTSAGTMNKVDPKAREYLADQADLIGAIRLPGDAFAENAGTKVTTDIVMLRKRLPGEQAGDRSWTETVEVTLPDRKGQPHTGRMSRYFAENPDMVLGEHGFFDQLVGGPRYAVRSRDGDAPLPERLAAAIESLPADIVKVEASSAELVAGASALDFESTERKTGSFYIGQDGALYQQQGSVGRKVETRSKGTRTGLSAKDEALIRQLVPMRDTLRKIFAHDLSGRAKEADAARAELNRLYDAFTKKNGAINKGVFTYRRPNRIQMESARRKAREEARARGLEWRDGTFDAESLFASGMSLAQVAAAREEARAAAERAGARWDEGSFDPEEVPDTVIEKRPNIDAFMEDPESYRLRSIEHYNDTTDEAKKGPVFFENVVSKQGAPRIESASDALPYVLNLRGRVDLIEIGRLAGVSPADAAAALAGQIYRTPDGEWETSAKYLSGNIRKKLAEAERMAESDPSFAANVEALREALPRDLGKADVRATLGMNWIDPAIVEQFAKEDLGLSPFQARYQPVIAAWEVSGDRASAASISTWGTDRRSATELLSDALNGRSTKIYDTVTDPDGNKRQVLNEQATQAANDKLVELKNRFKDWVWQDDARAEKLLRIYNDRFNSHIAPTYDGGYLTTPGVSSLWSWRPHQARGIARMVQEGNTYLAHAVGAGKTSTMIGASQEMKRLGLVNKPMFVVPNHMLVQFTKEFYELYPTANIMVADETRNFITDKRKQFVADAATSNVDAIIIKHSAFGLIPLSDEFQQAHLEEQLNDLRAILEEIPKSDPDTRITRRRVEQMVEQTEQRIRAVTERKTDQTFTFEEMGVDFLFVDEAHLFRKLDFPTSRGEVKGIDPQGSTRSMDLFLKTRYLEQRRPGRSHALASGTPITNTMAELFTVSRYLQPGELEERGLSRFDAWASAFGDTVTDLEPTAGGSYKPVTRFSQFVNVPELSAMVRQIMDVVTPAELEQYVTRPKPTYREVIVPQTQGQEAYREVLARREKLIAERGGPPKPGDDIILSVINDGRNAAIDMRLVDPSRDEERSKLMVAIENVFDVWKSTKDAPFYAITKDGYSAEPAFRGPAAQMVFASRGVGADRAFNVHKFMVEELAKRGVPRSEMVIFNAIKNDVAKQRVFNDMNDGKVRILFGSVDKMGTGVNAQRRLVANHNMDPEWLPSSDEQRNGRIIRQGNLNREVTIYNYSTKGSYDEQMWRMMARKAKFIEGFFRGDPTLRDMEDLGEASRYEQLKALTTRDPRILELTEAKQALEKEYRRRTAHSSDIATARREARHARELAARSRWLLEQQRADAAQAEDIGGDRFTAQVGDRTFTKRDEFQAALDEALGGAEREGSREIGRLGGFPLYALDQKTITYDGDVRGSRIESVPILILNGDDNSASRYDRRYKELSPTNTAASAQAFLTRMPNLVTGTEAEIERLERRSAEFEKRATGAGDYQGQAAIDELEAKVASIEADLQKDAPAPKQSIAEEEPVISLTGQELGRMPDNPALRVKILRDRALDWYRKNLEGSTVTGSDGVPVLIQSRAGMRKTVAGKGEDLLRAVPAISAIIEKGAVRELPRQRDDMTAFLYTAPIELEGRVLRVAVIARQDSNGRRHYNLTMDTGKRSVGSAADAAGALSGGPGMEASPDASFNLFIDDGEFNSDGNAPGWADVRIDLEARLRVLGMGDRLVVEVVSRIDGERRVAGEYLAPVITIALDQGQAPRFTLDHEAVHALRDMGLFLPPEWRTLEAAARADKAMMASARRRYPALSEEALVEEAVADRFARWASGTDERGFVARVFERVRDFLRAFGEALRGNGFTTPESVMRAIEGGDIGGRGEVVSTSGTARQSVPAEHSFESEETERRFRDATKGLGNGEGMIARVRVELAAIRDKMTRHWVALPNVPKYAALQQKLRALEAAPQAAKERTIRLLQDMVKDFDAKDLDLLARKVILDDLMWEAGQDHELPFGLTPETLKAEKARVDAILQAQPDQKVWNAAMRRKLINRRIAEELVDAGVLTSDRIKNPAYFRHQVLDYARAQARIAQSGKKKLRSPKWARRMGSSLDINANLLEAEFDWLAKALTDIPTARTIEWIKRSEHNILDRLRREGRDRNRAGMAAKLDAAEKLLASKRGTKAELEAAAAFVNQEKGLRQRIAHGFSTVEKAYRNGEFTPPRELQAAAEALSKKTENPQTFALLSWLLDEDQPGAVGAASVLKAIAERRAWQKMQLGDAFIDTTNAQELVDRLAPDGYTTWQPDEGKLLFTVKTIPEHVIDGMVGAITTMPGLDPKDLLPALEKARSALSMGGDKYAMILPQEVADTLNALRREDVEGLLGEALAVPMRYWKRWILINPRRVIKYNLNNLTGDLDAVLAGNPKLLRHVKVAAIEVAKVMRDKAKPSARYEEAVARGVFDSGLTVQEIPEINRLSAFEQLTEPKSLRPDKATIAALGVVWRGLQGFTQWRENVFRYAAYLDYVERIEAGESMRSIGYGASVPAMVDAVVDKKDKAALLARDLIGDYGAISEGGAWLRTHAIPFWSWMEINTKRYWRLSLNAYEQGLGKGIATGGALALANGARLSAWLGLRMLMVYGAISLWNWLFFDDEEEELSDEQRRQLHIILGRNDAGEVVTLRTQGALSDALSWFGLHETAAAFKAYESGRGSLGDVLAAPFKAPINKVATAVSPAISIPIESATGKKLWPDVFETRVNRDPWRNLFSTLSLENEYDLVTSKPSRGYARSWIDSVLYRRDPGEIAYDEARGIAYDWLRETKGQEGASSFSTPRSEATRDFKQARRFGDESAEARAIEEMIALGMTDSDLSASLKRAEPLGPIAKKDRAAFLGSLSEEERATFEQAQTWYEATFR